MHADRRSRQRGQAMIETLIAAALVLVPLFLAVPVIAKYLDIRSHVVQAARYAAWERTVWFGGDAAAEMGLGGCLFGCSAAATLGIDLNGAFSNKWDANEKEDNAIRAEIGARILTNTDAGSGNAGKGFSDNDKSDTGYVGGAKPFWQDRRGKSLLVDYSDISDQYDNDKAPGIFNDLFSPVMSVAAVVSNFTVDTHAQYTANVGIAVKQIAFNPDTGLAGCPGCPSEFAATNTSQAFSEKSVIVANGWSANGPGSIADYKLNKKKITVYNQVRGLTPTSVLKPADGVFRDVLNVLIGNPDDPGQISLAKIFFPELSTLDLGRIQVDRVPADRLK